jgi:predicted nucleotidyltransferase
VIYRTPLPSDIEARIHTLGQVLERTRGIVFAYLFGGPGASRLTPLSDVDVAVYLDEGVDPLEGKLETIGALTAHLKTDEVDVVVLNEAPTALVGRILRAVWRREAQAVFAV